MAVGVLALQGGFAAHEAMLLALGHEVVRVREPAALVGLRGLVLPGGESPVMLRLLRRFGLWDAVRDFPGPVLATCAGLILCAAEVRGPGQPGLGLLDVTVTRNAWGRQVESFEARADQGAPLVFIRAPRIDRVGPAVQILLTYRDEPVLVRQGRVTGASFHPELAADPSLHREIFGAACGHRPASYDSE